MDFNNDDNASSNDPRQNAGAQPDQPGMGQNGYQQPARPQVQPGWYTNTQTGRVEWWDGYQWIAPTQPTSQQYPQQQPFAQQPAIPQQPIAQQSFTQQQPSSQQQPYTPPQQQSFTQQPATPRQTFTQPPYTPRTSHTAQGATGTAVKSRKPVNKKFIAIIAAVIAVIVAAVSTGLFLHFRNNNQGIFAPKLTKEQVYGTKFTDKKYDLQDPKSGIAYDSYLEVPFTQAAFDKIKPTVEGTVVTGDLNDVFQIFTDPNLSLPANYMAYFDTNSSGKTVIRITGSYKYDWGSDDYRDNSGWGGSDGYWMVQYKDENGNDLKKPRLTYFTVDKTKVSDTLATPANLTLGVTDDGVLTMDWPKVEGAKKYEVYFIEYDPLAGNDDESTIYRRLGSTTKTSVQLDEFDKFCGPTSCEKSMGNVMNQQIASVVKQSQDDAANCQASGVDSCNTGNWRDMGDDSGNENGEKDYAYAFKPEEDLNKGWIGVTAVDDSNLQTNMRTASLDGVLGSLPLEAAYYANRSHASTLSIDRDYTSSDAAFKAAASYFITMADGTTRVSYITLTDKNYVYEGRKDANKWVFSIPGTRITDEISLLGNEGEDPKVALTTFRKYVDKLRSADSKAGLVNVKYTLPDSAIDFKKVDAMKPDSRPIGQNGVEKYKPYGSNDYAKYLAENLYAMHTFIDVTEYASVPTAPVFSDVTNEVLSQNPYLADVAGVNQKGIQMKMLHRGSKYYVYVQYGDNVKQWIDESYNKAVAVAKTITAGNSAEGVMQIEQWLANNSSYDHAGYNALQNGMKIDDLQKNYPRTWGLGNLVNGLGVCASYAHSFDAIADQVGIKSYYVTGDAQSAVTGKSRGLHAWNRVNIGDTWYDTDPTWDDIDTGAQWRNMYYMKKANTLKLHTVDTDWMQEDAIAAHGGHN